MSSADTEKQETEHPETQLESPESQPSVAEQAPELQDGMNPACRREITVEIPAEVTRKEWEGLIQSYTKQARVPGFRHGKVPASIIRQRFSEEIKDKVLQSLVPRHLHEAYEKEGFFPISQPLVRDLEMAEGQPIRFKVVFETVPEIELGQYQEIKVEKPEITVSDEEVENGLKRLQEQKISFDPVNEDRPLEDGDFAQISFNAVPKPAPAPPSEGAEAASEAPTQQDEGPAKQMEEALVGIGDADTIPEFSENLRGAKSGEERTFDVSYADDFYDDRVKGKSFTYTVKVNGLKKKVTPELNDEFAKEVNQEFQSLDDLKKRIRESMEHQRKHKAEHEAKEKLMEQLVAQHDFPVPEALVKRQIDIRLDRGLRGLMAQGLKEEHLQHLDIGRLRADQRDAALKEVKCTLLLDKIARVENIEVGEDEVDREIGALAQRAKQTPEAVRKQLSENGAIERIRDSMRGEKALEWLYSKSA